MAIYGSQMANMAILSAQKRSKGLWGALPGPYLKGFYRGSQAPLSPGGQMAILASWEPLGAHMASPGPYPLRELGDSWPIWELWEPSERSEWPIWPFGSSWEPIWPRWPLYIGD